MLWSYRSAWKTDIFLCVHSCKCVIMHNVGRPHCCVIIAAVAAIVMVCLYILPLHALTRTRTSAQLMTCQTVHTQWAMYSLSLKTAAIANNRHVYGKYRKSWETYLIMQCIKNYQILSDLMNLFHWLIHVIYWPVSSNNKYNQVLTSVLLLQKRWSSGHRA